jgi:hypothetical protein
MVGYSFPLHGCGDIQIYKMGGKYSTNICPETHLHLIVKPPSQRPLGRRGCRWKNIIKNNFRNEGGGLDLTVLV